MYFQLDMWGKKAFIPQLIQILGTYLFLYKPTHIRQSAQ